MVLFSKLSEEFTQELVSQSLFYSFSGDLLCAGDSVLTSSSRTFPFLPVLSLSALQLIENPLILSVPYQIKTSIQVKFQISAALP